jgi:hypothetical protein
MTKKVSQYSLTKSPIIVKNNYKELNLKILSFQRKRKRKMESHINETFKTVTRLIISPQLKTNRSTKVVH